MKKVLTIILLYSLVFAMAFGFTFTESAEVVDEVTVGSTYEWNSQAGDPEKELAWRRSKGTSPDGLWKYQFYSIVKDVYRDLVYAEGNQFGWSTKPGPDDGGIGYARVRQYGENFHPAERADVVKVFTCPSGGTIQISTTIARTSQLQSGSEATGTSFAIYIEDRLVYPEAENGEFVTLVSTSPQTFEVSVEVRAGERVRFHIGAIGDQGGDGVNMSNVITYKSVNNEVADDLTDKTFSRPTYTGGVSYTVPDVVVDDGDAGVDRDSLKKDNGISNGLVIGVVVAVLAVIGTSAVAIMIIKKRK